MWHEALPLVAGIKYGANACMRVKDVNNAL